MPRESIHDESGVEAQVVFSHDQYVQVAVLSTNEKEFVEWARQLVEQYDAKGELNAHLGMFWTPKRSQINDLIRNLRRARDYAFGKDE